MLPLQHGRRGSELTVDGTVGCMKQYSAHALQCHLSSAQILSDDKEESGCNRPFSTTCAICMEDCEG